MEPTLALIQLPVLDLEPVTMRGNVQLAVGALKAYCVAAGGADSSSIRIIPRVIVDHGGDAAIIAWVKSIGPDLVGFSCSMWNLRRSEWLAAAIKKADPDILTLAGGPEIVSGQPVMESRAFDSFVLGEGEGPMLVALGDLRSTGTLRRTYGPDQLLDLDRVPNPYLLGVMEPRPHDPLYVETLRGCSHHCSYCYCGKSYARVRHFPQQIVERVFHWARAHEISQVYILDPSFDSLPAWEERLKLYGSLNSGGMSLHTEIHLESIDTPERADLLHRAGFKTIEVGLQSTNDRALKAVHRAWDRERFLRGAALAKERGIRVTVGIILGLPEDTREGFAATVGFLADNGLLESMNILPLSVLPGTLLRDEAKERGIRSMPEPPYLTLSTPTMSEDDMRACIQGLSGGLTRDTAPFTPPYFGDELEGFTRFLDLRDGGAPARPERLANNLTILMSERQMRDTSYLNAQGAWFLRHVPHSLYEIVIESESPFDAESGARVARAFDLPERWHNTARFLSRDPQDAFSVRLFRLSRRIGGDRGTRETADRVLRFNDGLLREEAYLREKRPFLLLEGPVSDAVEHGLARIYAGREKYILRTPHPI